MLSINQYNIARNTKSNHQWKFTCPKKMHRQWNLSFKNLLNIGLVWTKQLFLLNNCIPVSSTYLLDAGQFQISMCTTLHSYIQKLTGTCTCRTRFNHARLSEYFFSFLFYYFTFLITLQDDCYINSSCMEFGALLNMSFHKNIGFVT